MTKRIIFADDSYRQKTLMRKGTGKGFLITMLIRYTPVKDAKTANICLLVMALLLSLATIAMINRSFVAEPSFEVTNFTPPPPHLR